MSSEINKLSNLVSNHLKIVDKKITGNEQFHWNRLKRTPQILKQKIKFAAGSYTVDQTFNELDEELIAIEASIKKLSKYAKVFGESMNQILSNSVGSAESFQNLIDPYTNLKNDSQILDDAYTAWSKITKYKHKVKDIFVETEIDHLVSSVEKKLSEICKIYNAVFKKIELRKTALLDYDKVYNDHESLLLKQEQSELTLKQNNQLYSLERKLEDTKTRYTRINSLLVRELPLLICFTQEAMGYVQAHIYYVHLTFCYQVSERIKEHDLIENDVNKIVSDFLLKNDPIVKEIETSILAPHQIDSNNDYAKINESYCYALHDFAGEEESDLRFSKGDKIKILVGNGTWWEGQLHGKIGQFPSNYVQLV
ncbi:starvation-or genotoxic-stress mediator, protein, putative [Candida dubliniensis CD36]|uniref:Starvation-or genotoxic-stress mediator, protein, putative n=1 Tax=Candida dubliniensis (strain CD36 / ATCC MYA-646 / CBS 7987 / NCPF 3949 / NRRL Y-17841) TaxID=573826 RepID=B9W8R0_CANDC|nr:starvation-or genotoxic-stress mediator, protein, putative [Candida dubliniensis CD36]CAX45133.1 starvation-or genotoxic-stress mediator, protein, putative [Candida dubliniensis CD36]